MQTFTRFFAATSAALLFTHAAAAQHGGDIHLSLENGRISTGLIGEGSVVTPGVRVFEAALGELVPGFTDEPGFDSEPGTFPVPSANGFRIRRALRAWNGADFHGVAAPTISVGFGPLGPVDTPATDTIVNGFTLPVGSNGQWHRHLEYTLSPATAEGIFLLELSLFSTDAGIGESRPFWLVLGAEAADPDVEAAAAWVRRHLVCPADFNGDGSVGVQDIFDFLAAYFADDAAADVNGSGGVTVQDIFAYLAIYFAGCAD